MEIHSNPPILYYGFNTTVYGGGGGGLICLNQFPKWLLLNSTKLSFWSAHFLGLIFIWHQSHWLFKDCETLSVFTQEQIPSVHTCGLALQSGEKKRGSYLCSSDMLRGQGIRCVIWEMRHWKTPPDHHLNCAIQIAYFAYTRGKIPSFEWSITQMIIQIAHFALVWKPLLLNNASGPLCGAEA